MVQCCVLGCKSRRKQGTSDVTFHRFPKKEDVLKVWVEACGRYNWKPTENTRMCSKHFKNACIKKHGNKTFLIQNAVPTNHIFIYDHSKPCCSSSNQSSTKHIETIKTQKAVDVSPSSTTKGKIEIETPRKKKLRKISTDRLRKLRAVRQINRRLSKRNEELTNILIELRSKFLLSSEDTELLKSIDTTGRDFLRLFTGIKGRTRKYSPSLRKFALCLHFISPRAYSYVRDQFNTCLPHPQTLTNWYRVLDGKPGFTKESLAAIKLKSQSISKKIFVALSFDEMALRKGVSYHNGEFFGTVNIGKNINNDEVRLANQALVFMVTAINDSWKIPVGYFLIESLSGEQKAELLKRCIVLLTECNVEVITVTCDGCPSNFSMARVLGCKIDCSDPHNINPIFNVLVKDVMKTVCFYPDPPHMLKLLRNILGDRNVIISTEGEIKWDVIKSLHQLQENEGFHLANKLRKSHIDFAKQIMKVKLAAQTFSTSVADAIDFCRCELELSAFQDSAPTSDFIRKINNLFDVLNSRNINAYGYKKPLNKNNFEEISLFLNEMLTYLNRLEFQDGQNISKSNRKCSIIGFSCVIRSLLIIYDRLIASGDLIFLSAYKLCQDHLESFFSAVRAKGGFNNNPSPIQFKAAYKRLVVHGQIKHVTSGNCTILENIDILTYSQTRYERKINSSMSILRDHIVMEGHEVEETNLSDHVLHDHDYLTDPSTLTEYTKEAIAYIAGFVVTRLAKIIKCGSCLECIIDASKTVGRFTIKKDKGGLCYPHADVLNVCLITEKVYKRNLIKSGSKLLKQSNLLQHESFKMCSKNNFFKDHGNMFDQSPLDNHELLLIKAIITEYLKVRLHYFSKMLSEPDVKLRNFYNKLILFKNQ